MTLKNFQFIAETKPSDWLSLSCLKRHLPILIFNFLLIEIPRKSHLIACQYIVILGVIGFLVYVIHNAMGKFSYQQAKWISLYKDVRLQYGLFRVIRLHVYFRQKTA